MVFNEAERAWLVSALVKLRGSIERGKSKAVNPKFHVIYDEELKTLAALTMKVQAMEVEGERTKVSR